MSTALVLRINDALCDEETGFPVTNLGVVGRLWAFLAVARCGDRPNGLPGLFLFGLDSLLDDNDLLPLISFTSNGAVGRLMYFQASTTEEANHIDINKINNTIETKGIESTLECSQTRSTTSERNAIEESITVRR